MPDKIDIAYKNLASAICEQCFIDYKRALECYDELNINVCETFLKSQWFTMLSDMNGERIIKLVKENTMPKRKALGEYSETLSTKEFAELAGMYISSPQKLIVTGKLKAIKEDGETWRIPKEEALKYIEKRNQRKQKREERATKTRERVKTLGKKSFYSVAEVDALLGVYNGYISRNIRQGKIKAKKKNGKWRISHETLQELLKQRNLIDERSKNNAL